MFLEKIIAFLTAKLKGPSAVIVFATLTVFTMSCEFSPPITRAWLSFMLRKINEEQKFFWRGHHLALYSGILSLLLFPKWVVSLSFLLSWGAALFISVECLSGLKKHFLIYVGLIPLFYTLQINSPLSALINWLLGPIIAFLLLPACLLSFVLPVFVPLTDALLSMFTHILHVLSLDMATYPSTQGQLSYVWAWFFIWVNQWLIMRYSIFSLRKKNFEFENAPSVH